HAASDFQKCIAILDRGLFVACTSRGAGVDTLGCLGGPSNRRALLRTHSRSEVHGNTTICNGACLL
ncbi:MAG TPA: hypothetical protein VHQ21_18610, partial [Rhodanobacteraceae bacterium]|nr:hypothetical protein [Rhodanobacteraceae bacterium]